MKKCFSLVLFLMSLSFTAVAADQVVDCDHVISTLEINHCASIDLALAKTALDNYLAVSFEHLAYDPELIESIKVAQQNWQVYMSSHCDSVYTQWREGTIRGVMAISCKTTLTKQRTHDIWANFLTFMDSTPAVLPEPKK